MPYLDAHRFGAFQPMAFLQPYFVVLLPNLIFTGAIFFALAALTRQMMPNYMGGAMMLVGYLLAGNLTQGHRERTAGRTARSLRPHGLSVRDEVLDAGRAKRHAHRD